MCTDADGCPAQIVFADIDGVEGRIPRILPPGEDILFGYGVSLQRVFGNIVLGADDIFHQVKIVVLGIDYEKHVFIGFRILAEGRHQGRLICVSDIVFPTVGNISPFSQGRQGHFAGVEIGPVPFFR